MFRKYFDILVIGNLVDSSTELFIRYSTLLNENLYDICGEKCFITHKQAITKDQKQIASFIFFLYC